MLGSSLSPTWLGTSVSPTSLDTSLSPTLLDTHYIFGAVWFGLLKKLVWIIEDPTAGDITMHVHHDIVIPAFPLCTAWLDCPIKGGEKGNLIDVGSMEPAIEIWDLDIMDAVQPSAA